jgi:hypothetical protein
MKNIEKLYMNIYPNALREIIDGLYSQVTDEIENKSEYDKEDLVDTQFKKDCLVLALEIYIEYNHVREEYKDMLDYINTLKT